MPALADLNLPECFDTCAVASRERRKGRRGLGSLSGS
jgi:hypothetical protein